MSDFERLNIILAARDREFQAAMERNARRMERFAARSQKGLSATSRKFDLMGAAAKRLAPVMAALGAGAVINRVQAVVSTLDDIGKTADKIGLTTDALQEYRTIAESAGVSQGTLDASLERFNKRLGEAQLGGGAAAKMLAELGLEADALAASGLDEAVSRVADRIAAIPEPTQRAAAAAALFGREGVAMVNLLREGSAGMASMRQEARDLGIVIDEKLIRSAEDAQTKLDLMGRVISAQLNSALIDLAPLLVGGATAMADFARLVNSAIEGVQNLVNPQSDLALATDQVVAAMADEIRQSQILDQALSNGITMSQGVARAKLQEARTRHENARAALAEHRAMVLNSEEWQGYTSQIADAQNALNASGFHGDKAVAHRADAYEQEQQRLAGLLVARQDLLKANQDLEAQLERTGRNVATLEGAIGQSGGGLVNVAGGAVQPIEAAERDRIRGSGRAAAAAVPELSDYADVMARIKGAFGDAAAAGSSYSETLAQIEAMKSRGILSEAEYETALEAVEDRFRAAQSASESLRQSAVQTLSAITTRAESAGDAVAGLLENLAGMFANAAFGGLLKGAGIFDAVGELLSFDGGGRTPSGRRSGGLDGKGGFLGLLHPDEVVHDLTKGRAHRAPGLPSFDGGGLTGGLRRATLAPHLAGRSGATIPALAAPAGAGQGRSVNIHIDARYAQGMEDIRQMIGQGLQEGLQAYDRSVLPASVQRINQDPRRAR